MIEYETELRNLFWVKIKRIFYKLLMQENIISLDIMMERFELTINMGGNW